jgi:alpha-glucosidase
MRKIHKFYLISVLFIAAGINYVSSSEIGTLSPNQFIAIKFKLDDAGIPYYNITYWNTTFVSWSPLGLNLKEGGPLGKDLKLVSVSRKTVDETYPVFSGKSKYSRDWCNETKIVLEESSGQKRKMVLYFRAYDDGAAFRYGIPDQGSVNDFTLSTEETNFNFAGDYSCWALKRDRFRHSYEGEYLKYKLSTLFSKTSDTLSTQPYITLPLTIEITGNLYACLSEANITDYAGMYLIKGEGNNSLKSKLSPYPDDNSISVKGKSPAVSPWRLFIIGKKPGDLIESNLTNHVKLLMHLAGLNRGNQPGAGGPKTGGLIRVSGIRYFQQIQ